MWRYVLVAFGSAAGGVCRYGAGELLTPRMPATLPLPAATLLVNVLGCYVLSLVQELALRGAALSPETRLMLTTGFCGGFTTYSTFNFEMARLYQDRSLAWSSIYLLLTVVLCLLAHLLGTATARFLGRAHA